MAYDSCDGAVRADLELVGWIGHHNWQITFSVVKPLLMGRIVSMALPVGAEWFRSGSEPLQKPQIDGADIYSLDNKTLDLRVKSTLTPGQNFVASLHSEDLDLSHALAVRCRGGLPILPTPAAPLPPTPPPSPEAPPPPPLSPRSSPPAAPATAAPAPYSAPARPPPSPHAPPQEPRVSLSLLRPTTPLPPPSPSRPAQTAASTAASTASQTALRLTSPVPMEKMTHMAPSPVLFVVFIVVVIGLVTILMPLILWLLHCSQLGKREVQAVHENTPEAVFAETASLVGEREGRRYEDGARNAAQVHHPHRPPSPSESCFLPQPFDPPIK